MLLTIEGPNCAGKTSLIKATQANFAEQYIREKHWVGKDPDNGLGYLRHAEFAVQSKSIFFWDRGWIGEYVYGHIYEDERYFATFPKLCHWVYGKLTNGRGATFIVMPKNLEEALKRWGSDEKDDPHMNAMKEMLFFSRYAKLTNTPILTNTYEPDWLLYAAQTTSRGILLNQHKISAHHYVGALKPVATFVGDSVPEGATPFTSLLDGHWFLGLYDDWYKFGWATPEGIDANPDFDFGAIITTTGEAQTEFPQAYRAPIRRGFPSAKDKHEFARTVEEILE